MHAAVAGHPEPGGLHVPLAHCAGGVEVGQGQDLEVGAEPLVAGVPDAGVVLGDVGEDPAQAQDPPGPSDLGNVGVTAPGALRGRGGSGLLRLAHVDVAAGLAAEPPLGLVAQVGGVNTLDLHLQAAGVEGGAGGELVQGVDGGPVDVAGLGVELVAVRVAPGDAGG